MNPYQIMGIIACGTSIFAGVVAFLTMQGIPVLLAFLCVYLIAVWVMLGMQRRAQQYEDGRHHQNQRRYDRESAMRRVHITEHVDAKLHAAHQLRV